MSEHARQILAEAAGNLTASEVQRLKDGDAALADAKRAEVEDDRSWMWTVTGVTALMTVVLPTAGLYQFFRMVNNLAPIELIGVIAAACLLAAAQAVVPVVLYTNWTRRRLCYRALHALANEDLANEDLANEDLANEDGDAEARSGEPSPPRVGPSTQSEAGAEGGSTPGAPGRDDARD